MGAEVKKAPGGPGISPRWTSSAKSGIGTALSATSRLWFTLSHGILNEIYYPRVDLACTRDMGMIVTNGKGFFSEEKRHTDHESHYISEGVPGYNLVNTCKQKRYRIEKEIIADPARDSILQKTKFVPLQGNLEDYHLYVLLAPHLADRGSGQSAWVGEHKGVTMLFTERDNMAVALACSMPWAGLSVGFVGVSDGWQDLVKNKEMTWFYDRAENGNVAMTGEIDLRGSDGECLIVVGFGDNVHEAGHRALSSLMDEYGPAREQFIKPWAEWQDSLHNSGKIFEGEKDLYKISTAVMRSHEAKSFIGGIIASLSIPWGFAKGDEDLGGYHLVWPRDLVETAGALHAAGATEVARRVVRYLQHTQDPEGKWPQNMWLDGYPYWSGIQMDEAALPILLIDHLRRDAALNSNEVSHFWPMVKKAAGYLVRNGPVTQEDRWEVDPGYSPYTLSAEISALLAAADIADMQGKKEISGYLRETADHWNENIERWTYVENTELDRKAGVEGHYMRIGPENGSAASSPKFGFVPIKGRTEGDRYKAEFTVGPDALALVRFGLRSPHDPKIVNTVKLVDHFLKNVTACGPAWRRYIGDRYGEHQDGSPYDGNGIGRSWPLLTGERAHYELAAGNRDGAVELLKAMERFSNEGGMIPEQVWDAEDIPERELFNGRPSGSAMPLVWAHAEYVKLRRSLEENSIFDMPPQTVQRYLVEKKEARFASWRYNNKISVMLPGIDLRIEVLAAARIRWSIDGWKTIRDTDMIDTGLGLFYADLKTSGMAAGTKISFTFYWTGARCWEQTNYEVEIRKRQ